MAYSFTQEKILPHVADWEREKYLPVKEYREAAELGFAGIVVPEEYGGCGLGRLEASLIFEAISSACAPTSAFLTIQNMISWILATHANDQMREKYLPKLLTQEHIASYCLTEPGSGSDSQGMQTKAVDKGDHWVVNGSKTFISGAGVADFYLVMCLTGEKEISCLVVDKGSEGLSFGKVEEKMGWHVDPLAMVILEDVKVPKENVIGDRGNGFKVAMSALDGGRLNIASCSLGGAARALDNATTYVKERKQFGKRIADFQHTQFRLAEMATDLEASRLMVRHAAGLLDQKDMNATMYCAMAKKFATDKGFDIANGSLQLFGGYGYLKEYPVEKIVRDLRVH